MERVFVWDTVLEGRKAFKSSICMYVCRQVSSEGRFVAVAFSQSETIGSWSGKRLSSSSSWRCLRQYMYLAVGMLSEATMTMKILMMLGNGVFTTGFGRRLSYASTLTRSIALVKIGTNIIKSSLDIV